MKIIRKIKKSIEKLGFWLFIWRTITHPLLITACLIHVLAELLISLLFVIMWDIKEAKRHLKEIKK
jgi:hypothetical protein